MSSAKKAMTKTEILGALAERCELSRKQVEQVLEGLSDLIEESLKEGGPGVFTVPGLLKIRVVHKPATEARMGKNPFTGEEMMIAAKPARSTVKVTALKGLKDMV